MNKSLWQSISYLGVTDEMDFRLARRIVLSNRFGILIAFSYGSLHGCFFVPGEFCVRTFPRHADHFIKHLIL